MKSLTDALAELRSRMGAEPCARIWIDSDSAFYMGAAAMAEQFALFTRSKG